MPKRPNLPTDDDGNVCVPFGRLDEPAVCWQGDLASLTAHLNSPEEAARRKKDVAIILSDPGYRRLAIQQLEIGIETVRRWASQEPHKFRRHASTFVIERVLAELELAAQATSPKEWPELFRVIADYRHLRQSTAPLRFHLGQDASKQTPEA